MSTNEVRGDSRSTLWVVAAGLVALVVNLLLPDGPWRDLAFAGIVCGLLALFSMGARRDQERERSGLVYHALAIHGSDVVLTVEDGRIVHCSHAVERVLGYWASELAGTPVEQLFHPDDRDVVARLLEQRGEQTMDMTVRAPRVGGEIRYVDLLITDHTLDPTLGAAVVTMRDVTDRVEAEERLRRQALHDSLTGLANRALALDRLEHALAQREGRDLAVLFVDLDDFKTINDGMGHAAGDRVLVVIADRLRRVIRSGDTAARLGGDEFAVLLPTAEDQEEARRIADRVREAISQPIDMGDRRVTVGGSVGIAFATSKSTAASLMREADTAMYAAKKEGGQGQKVFQPRMHTEAVRRLELARELPEALDNGDFQMLYQPIVDLSSGRLAGVEALVRWQHPERGSVSPVEFIPFAEDSGLILPLGRWIIEQAGRDAARLGREFSHPIRTNINVSARQFEVDGFVDHVSEVLVANGLDPARIGIELTESMLMTDPEATVSVLHALSDLGTVLLIDDFGTGYCSLSYLHRFPVDVLKIDRAFVSELERSEPDGSFVEAIVGLARAQRLAVVAEGVESEDVQAKLVAMGVASGQGWLYGRPQPVQQIIEQWGGGATVAGLQDAAAV